MIGALDFHFDDAIGRIQAYFLKIKEINNSKIPTEEQYFILDFFVK